MVHKKNFFLPAGIIIGAILMNSCIMSRKPLLVQDRPVKKEAYEGVTTTFQFVDEAILKEKYRKEYNPFLTDYNKMQLRRIIVFELTVDNKSRKDVLFVLNRLELQYGGKSIQPYNRFLLDQHWAATDEDRGIDAIDITKREKIINSTVLPNTHTLPAGSIIKGYAVFVGNTPNYGPARVYIPLFQNKEELLHRFEFPFEF